MYAGRKKIGGREQKEKCKQFSSFDLAEISLKWDRSFVGAFRQCDLWMRIRILEDFCNAVVAHCWRESGISHNDPDALQDYCAIM